MASIISALWRRLTGIADPPRYQSPFFVFAQVQLARAYYVAAELRIAELVREQPRTAGQLAEAAGCHADSLFRLLRVLASFGVFAQDSAGKFHLTKRAEVLLADAPGSLRKWILFEGQPELWQGYAQSLAAVRSGVPALELATGQTFYDCVAGRPQFAEAFYGALANWGDMHCRAILQAYDFSRFRSVVDVGGGQGRLVELLAEKYPQLHGIVLDLPETIRQAGERLATTSVADRCQCVAGDFFESVPAGADAYLIRDVLSDWVDERATAILATCAAAMQPQAVLLVADTILDPRSAHGRIPKLMDVQRAALMRAGKRTQAQLEGLLHRAGLTLVAIHPTAVVDVQLMEARIAPAGREPIGSSQLPSPAGASS